MKRGRRRWSTVVLIVAAAGLAVAAAFIILDRTTLTDSGAESGVIPEEMPDGFPIPPGASIGAGSVTSDPVTVTLEVTTDGAIVDAVSAHTIGLVSAGYVVTESASSGGGWVIRFSRLDLRGSIELAETEAGVLATITVIDPG